MHRHRQRLLLPLGDLAPGATATIVLTTQAAPDTYHNTASVSSATNDPDVTNDTAVAAFTLDRLLTELTVDKQGPPQLVAGSTFSYAIPVFNLGPSIAEAVAVADTLPAGLTPTGVQTNQGTCTTITQTSPATSAH
jgi:uncharacterized repeat protein (TIGR01451 family)